MKKINFNTIFVTFGLALFITLSACSSSTKYTEDIKMLDSMSVLVGSATAKFKTLDTVQIHQRIEELKSNLSFIEKNNRDTIKRETAFLLSDYGLLRDPLIEINKRANELSEELEESQEQIENLVHDLKNGKVDETKANDFVQDERIAAQKAIENVEIITEITKQKMDVFEKCSPKIDELITKIKSKTPVVVH